MKRKKMLGVYIAPDAPNKVMAIVMNELDEPLAAKEWLLDEKAGLVVRCCCHEEECPLQLQRQEIMPARPGEIEEQIESEIENFARQFECSEILYGTGDPDWPDIVPALTLDGDWLNERTIGLARASWLARS